ncbi:hypothetical protein GS979_08735 [Rhodococcus hoagii]|nr:hypothetical protein [Prescottella equi]NKW46462.1 hypothetical protein [Prescottella equi]
MATPAPGTHTAPIVKVVSPMEAVQQVKNVTVTITADGSIVVGGTAEAHAKGLASVAEQRTDQ